MKDLCIYRGKVRDIYEVSNKTRDIIYKHIVDSFKLVQLYCGFYFVVYFIDYFEIHRKILPSSLSYDMLYSEFAIFHRLPGNCIWHLFTTGLGIIGILGMLRVDCKFVTPKTTNRLLVACCWVYIIVRYIVPDADIATMSWQTFVLCAYLTYLCKIDKIKGITLLTTGLVAQELCHIFYGEKTMMTDYLGDNTLSIGDKILKGIMHTVYLIPFELQAVSDSYVNYHMSGMVNKMN